MSFCTQVLAGETTVEYLANNYVVWAWDMTSDANRTRYSSSQLFFKSFFFLISFRLIETFKRCVGYPYAQRIVGMEKDSFPLLIVLIRSRGSLEVISVIEGKSTPSEVLLNLIQAHDLFEQQRQRDADEEIMRETRENLKKQQEDEYHRSLQADLAKEQAKLADEKRQQEEQDANERMKQKKLVNLFFEFYRNFFGYFKQQQRECEARLPAEPSDTEKNITRLKIRLPNDEGILMRRFRINDTLQVCLNKKTLQAYLYQNFL